ncbi:hypothetical protein Droror1_Dr00027760 [Drosera rotundifolia]
MSRGVKEKEKDRLSVQFVISGGGGGGKPTFDQREGRSGSILKNRCSDAAMMDESNSAGRQQLGASTCVAPGKHVWRLENLWRLENNGAP